MENSSKDLSQVGQKPTETSRLLFGSVLPEAEDDFYAAVSCVFVAVMLLLINIAIWIIVFSGIHIKKDTFAAKPVNFEVLKVGSGGRINDVSGFAAKPVNFEVLKVGSGGRINDVSNFTPVRVLGNGMINDVSGFAAKPVNFEVLKVGSGGRINDVSGFAAKPVNFEVKQDGAHSASFEVGNPYESVHE